MHTHTHTYRGRPTLVAIDGKKTVERRVGAAEKGLIDEDVFFGLCTKIWTQLAVSHRKPDKHQFLLLPSHKRTHFRSILLIRHGRTHAILGRGGGLGEHTSDPFFCLRRLFAHHGHTNDHGPVHTHHTRNARTVKREQWIAA